MEDRTMDSARFDALARLICLRRARRTARAADRGDINAVARLFAVSPSRRSVFGMLIGAGLGSAFGLAGAAKRDRQRPRRTPRAKRKRKQQTVADLSSEAADCANPGPSANLNGCNFNNRAFVGKDLSSSSMRGTRFRGTNLCGADLSSSQLKDADFRGFAAGQGSGNPTTLFRADLSSSGCTGTRFNDRTLFCQTRTCNGSIRDDDCPEGIAPQDVCCDDADCPEGRPCQSGRCCAPVCAGKPCGTDDGCGGTCPCPSASQICMETGPLRCCCPGQFPLPQQCIANGAQQVCCCPVTDPPVPQFCRVSPSGGTCCCSGAQQICADTAQGPNCQVPDQA
jgi:hypothetical protein